MAEKRDFTGNLKKPDTEHELEDHSGEKAGEPKGTAAGAQGPEREAGDSGIVSPAKNEILEKHLREHPEGDPAVRRVSPDRGSLPVEEVHDDGTMTVYEKEAAGKKRAG